jgi:hypothetical protein
MPEDTRHSTVVSLSQCEDSGEEANTRRAAVSVEVPKPIPWTDTDTAPVDGALDLGPAWLISRIS